MITVYRIYDHTDQRILADGIGDYEQAYTALGFLKLDYPDNEIELETYTRYTVKGLGRDPDLH